MCKECFNQLHFILDGCVKCGKPKINQIIEEESIESCGFCSNKSFYFDKAISCIEFSDLSKRLILGLKYSNKTYISRYIAQIMSEKIIVEQVDFDYILYVPLHKKRLKSRGFNQAEKIAKYLGYICDKDVVNAVDRVHNTSMLYKLKKVDRSKELKNAFVLNKNKDILSNKNVLLVDDIFTTGTTVNEISKILKVGGVNKVYSLSLLTKRSN